MEVLNMKKIKNIKVLVSKRDLIQEDPIIPTDDAIYQKVLRNRELNKTIEQLEAEVRELALKREKIGCDKPNLHDILKIVNNVNKATKAKYGDNK